MMALTGLMQRCRELGLADRDVAEWLFALCGRWLHAHGYSVTSLHQWLQHELEQPAPAPLTAAAAAPKDFGRR